jgi:16S rRNA (cytidine1402-2'-O)-methyltransferase
MLTVLGDRRAVVARELTKLHQEWIRGTLAEICTKYREIPPRGELTLVVAGAPEVPGPDTAGAREFMRRQRSAGVARQDAIQETTRLFGLARNETYRMWLAVNRDNTEGESVDDS